MSIVLHVAGSNRLGSGAARCLACGTPIEGPLAVLGSLRCADCRSARRSLDEALVRSLSGRAPRRGR